MSQYNDNPFYGNTGGGGGGGYLAGGSPFGSANGSPGGQLRKGALHSLRPVTIKQLLNATQAHSDAEWTIEDAEVGQITVIAQVVSINSQTTNCVYWLDDGTGRIEARHWVEVGTEDDAERWGGITENTYIRVMGGLKSFGNKRYINANHLRLVKDPNEIQFHLLEAFTVELIFQKGAPLRPSEAGSKGAVANGQGAASAYNPQSTATGGMEQYAHLPSIQRRIVEFMMSQPQQNEGVHVAAIARHIGGEANAISEALDRLMDEGHVFTTINDSHFALSHDQPRILASSLSWPAMGLLCMYVLPDVYYPRLLSVMKLVNKISQRVYACHRLGGWSSPRLEYGPRTCAKAPRPGSDVFMSLYKSV
ncbi:uncharacterized protein B0H18DRAFT_927723 [Fomitopsis serialis]|uniref:uncharacterized protein n=1 Tax=Fomitopsis serialis TaxID=139415 RepID=UPI0020082979|nr:uncharacterized protein B0H18DRAFT_927723 [Neoantrodia serialis]KAH9935018.1 hypothetical protein B0H18DRAFT_927723 [Neoantrodia serialis]